MLTRYFFFVLFGFLLTGLTWWSKNLDSSQGRGLAAVAPTEQEDQKGSQSATLESDRRELLEVLDRLVSYEHYYHSVYGHFTKLLHRVGYSIPKQVGARYEIRVAEATKGRLLINALSEVNGTTSDVVSVDQDYKVHASFPIPQPRTEFLRYRATRHLRQLWEAPEGQAIEELGIFTGFFKYEVRKDSQDQRVALAVGIRHPVLGLQLEYGSSQADQDQIELRDQASELLSELARFSSLNQNEKIGQSHSGAVMSTTEEVFLAQRIFRGEIGRYAQNWNELSRIANFEYENRQNNGHEAPSTASNPLEVNGKPGSAPLLEIEPLPSEN